VMIRIRILWADTRADPRDGRAGDAVKKIDSIISIISDGIYKIFAVDVFL
jgi:hypothetical protein